MGGCAPRALRDTVCPRRLSGVVVRPLTFTVRPHALGSACASNTTSGQALPD